MITNSPFSDPQIARWQDTRTVLEHVKTNVIPSIYETLVDDYGFANEETYDTDYFYDHLHEIIDSLSEVFVTWKARAIASAFCVDPFDVSEITGERYESWSEIAYEVLQQEFNETYKEQLNEVKY